MSDAHAVARDQLRSFIERIERLEEEKKTIADDIKDVKAEAKGCGFDVGTINAIIKLRKVDANERAEKDALLDTYLIALGMLPEPEEAEPVNAKLIATVATGMQTETGRKALVTALDIMIEREEAEDRRSDSGLNIVTKHTEITASPETATECAAPEKDAAADERSVEADGGAALVRTLSDKLREGGNNAQQVLQRIVSDRRHHSQGDKNTEKPQAAEQAGGEHEVATGSAMRAGLADPTSNTGEGAASALPAKSKLRPHCQRPGNTCGGYGDKHCHDCLRAMREYEAA